MSGFAKFIPKRAKRLKLDDDVEILDEYDEFLTLVLKNIFTSAKRYNDNPSSPLDKYQYFAFDPKDDETVAKLIKLIKTDTFVSKTRKELLYELSFLKGIYRQQFVEKLFAIMKLNVDWDWAKHRVYYYYADDTLYLAWYLFVRSPEYTEKVYEEVVLKVMSDQAIHNYKSKKEEIDYDRIKSMVKRLVIKMYENRMVIPLLLTTRNDMSNTWIYFKRNFKVVSSNYSSRGIIQQFHFEEWKNDEKGHPNCFLPIEQLSANVNNTEPPLPFKIEHGQYIYDIYELFIGIEWYEYYAGRPASFFYRLGWFSNSFNNDLIQLILSYIFVPCRRTTKIDAEARKICTTVTTIENKWTLCESTKSTKTKKTKRKAADSNDE
jgi:hypothetical protein